MSKYLITFDLDTTKLKTLYHGNSHTNAYYDIKNILTRHGFNGIQGSVYLGEEGVSEAHGTIAIQELTARFDWFYLCVSNIRFYRIESDLNAQFIADGVHNAKQRFYNQIEELRDVLVNTGLSEKQIEEVIVKQQFKLESITSIDSKK